MKKKKKIIVDHFIQSSRSLLSFQSTHFKKKNPPMMWIDDYLGAVKNQVNWEKGFLTRHNSLVHQLHVGPSHHQLHLERCSRIQTGKKRNKKRKNEVRLFAIHLAHWPLTGWQMQRMPPVSDTEKRPLKCEPAIQGPFCLMETGERIPQNFRCIATRPDPHQFSLCYFLSRLSEFLIRLLF